MWNNKVLRFGAIGAALSIVLVPCIAMAVVVDYNTSSDRTATTVFGFQHMVTARGYGNGDANGPGSGVVTTVGNGLRDGIEFSLFEYVYANDFSSLPAGALKTRLQDLHAQAVAKFDANTAALVDIIDAATDDGLICGHGVWGTDGGSLSDGGVSPSFNFPDCESSTKNPFTLEVIINVTVDQYLDYPSAVFGFMMNWGYVLYDFAADSNFDNSLSAVFGPGGDIDNDGLTNLAEVTAVTNDIIAQFGSNYDLGTRAQRDIAMGMFIDKVILDDGSDEGEEILEIVSHPSPGFIQEGHTLTLTAPAGSGLSYEWHFNNSPTPLSDTERITGTSSRVLTFSPVLIGDEGAYTCIYDDGTAKAVVETPAFDLAVLPAGSLPIAGMAGLCLLAAAFLGTGVRFVKRMRT